jgi:hypothetical protein
MEFIPDLRARASELWNRAWSLPRVSGFPGTVQEDPSEGAECTDDPDSRVSERLMDFPALLRQNDLRQTA